MFYRRKKPAFILTAQTELDDFHHALAELSLHADAGTRYIATKQLETRIDRQISNNRQILDALNDAKVERSIFGMAAMVPAVVCSVAVFGSPFLAFLMVPGALGIIGGSTKKYRADYRKISPEVLAHIDALQDLKERASFKAEIILHDHLQQLAQSPQINKVLQDYPAVKDHFAKAAIRELQQPKYQPQHQTNPKPKKGNDHEN